MHDNQTCRVRRTSAELQQTAKAHRADMTPAEKVLWEALRSRRLYGMRFRAQHPVEKFILDFYCPAFKLAVEVDGEVHDSSEAREHDRLRSEHMALCGYQVVRCRNEEVLDDLPAVLKRITDAAALARQQGVAPDEEDGSDER